MNVSEKTWLGVGTLGFSLLIATISNNDSWGFSVSSSVTWIHITDELKAQFLSPIKVKMLITIVIIITVIRLSEEGRIYVWKEREKEGKKEGK